MEITRKILQFDMSTTDEIAAEFGLRLRAHRLAQNMQQSELAARAGISERSLSNFERSGRGTLDLVLRIAISLGLIESMSTLFEVRPKSIKAMDLFTVKRERASRRIFRSK